jgi:hypothetical protein
VNQGTRSSSDRWPRHQSRYPHDLLAHSSRRRVEWRIMFARWLAIEERDVLGYRRREWSKRVSHVVERRATMSRRVSVCQASFRRSIAESWTPHFRAHSHAPDALGGILHHDNMVMSMMLSHRQSSPENMQEKNYIYTCVYIYIHIHIHIHTYTCGKRGERLTALHVYRSQHTCSQQFTTPLFESPPPMPS